MVVITEDMGVKELLKTTGILREVDGIMSLDYTIDDSLVDTETKKKSYIRMSFFPLRK